MSRYIKPVGIDEKQQGTEEGAEPELRLSSITPGVAVVSSSVLKAGSHKQSFLHKIHSQQNPLTLSKKKLLLAEIKCTNRKKTLPMASDAEQ